MHYFQFLMWRDGFMNKFLAGLLILVFQAMGMQSAHAFLQEVPGYVGNGSLFVETASIVRNGNAATLIYVENFEQPQSYGAITYRSKATQIRINCTEKRVFALKEGFYSIKSMRGDLLGSFPLNDEFGSTPEEGSWNFNLVNMGCNFAL